MTVAIVPIDVWPASFTEAANGDTVSQATRVDVIQEYADASTYLRNRSLVAQSGDLYVPITRAERATAIAEWIWNPDYNPAIANTGYLQSVVNVTPQETLWWEVLRVHGSGRITAIHVLYNGHGGPGAGHVALPAVLPRVRLLRIDHAAGDLAVVGTSTAAPASVVAYEVWQLLSIVGLGEQLSGSRSYYVEFRGEGGANSVASALMLSQIRATIGS